MIKHTLYNTQSHSRYENGFVIWGYLIFIIALDT